MVAPGCSGFPAVRCTGLVVDIGNVPISRSVVTVRYLLILLAFIANWNISHTWAASFESALMPGQVIQGHAKWEEDCSKCHKRFDKAAQAHLCQECHKDVREDINRKDRFHGRVTEQRECKDCHTDHKGREENIAPINEATFDHAKTNFALHGAHADQSKTACKACHKPKVKYRNAPSDCLACHAKDDKHKANFGEKCVACHTESSWKEIVFDHSRKTKYPLLHKHKTVKCESCHKGHLYKDKVKTDCFSCHHEDDYHKGVFGSKCETCHDEKEWKTSSFDHDKDTKYPLLGKHRTAKCDSCHKVAVATEKTPTTCYACHQKDDKHEGALGRACESCHTEMKWKDIDRFDHDKTKFPIRGQHRIVSCRYCHPDQRYKPTPLDCYSCHKKDDKHAGSFGSKCENCHTDVLWDEIAFDHGRNTKFPLLGKHRGVKCKSCHKTELYKEKTSMACYACHRKEDIHNGVFGEDCKSCHTEKFWKPSAFNHDRDTKYMLLGKHFKVKCEDCHKVPSGKGKTPTACADCHTNDDVHKGQYGERCESCHIAKSWKQSIFDHDRDTKYLLKEMHRSVKCQSCHKGRLYKDKTPTTCWSCHRKEDVHKGQFGDRCEVCHTEKKWKSILFDHERLTAFPLRGRHFTITCESCHTGHLYKDKLKTDCYSCHKKDDKHKGQEGQKCETCHLADSWRKVIFNHDSSTFPLRGAHDVAPCRKCHEGLAFKDAPSACVACHAKEDTHKRRLGTECQNCHNARDWKLWEFDHETDTDFILDGAHQKLDCYECHIKPMDKVVMTANSCVGCHKRDDKHEGGFGPQCDRCHGTDNWKTLKPGSFLRRK